MNITVIIGTAVKYIPVFGIFLYDHVSVRAFEIDRCHSNSLLILRRFHVQSSSFSLVWHGLLFRLGRVLLRFLQAVYFCEINPLITLYVQVCTADLYFLVFQRTFQ